MKHIKTLAALALSSAIVSLACSGHAQSVPTASQQLDLSVFAAGTGTFTRIAGGKNLSFTAGADLTYLPLRLLRPSLEIRGTYPVDTGHIDSQKSFLVGPKAEHAFGRFHPYVDFLFGRGEIDYHNNLFVIGPFIYLSSTSTIYSPGGGLDYHLGKRIDAKADIQYQRWETPVTSSGVAHPVALTLGAVYHFDFGSRHHH
jgi:hypothetical protein